MAKMTEKVYNSACRKETHERREENQVPTTGLFDFPELILGGKGKYIDKTDLLYDLCNETDQQLLVTFAWTRSKRRQRNPPIFAEIE